jgi:hypothetical protein
VKKVFFKKGNFKQDTTSEHVKSCMVHDPFIYQAFVSHVLTATARDSGIMMKVKVTAYKPSAYLATCLAVSFLLFVSTTVGGYYINYSAPAKMIVAIASDIAAHVPCVTLTRPSGKESVVGCVLFIVNETQARAYPI